jgi:hypothetical protein
VTRFAFERRVSFVLRLVAEVLAVAWITIICYLAREVNPHANSLSGAGQGESV